MLLHNMNTHKQTLGVQQYIQYCQLWQYTLQLKLWDATKRFLRSFKFSAILGLDQQNRRLNTSSTAATYSLPTSSGTQSDYLACTTFLTPFNKQELRRNTSFMWHMEIPFPESVHRKKNKLNAIIRCLFRVRCKMMQFYWQKSCTLNVLR